MYRAACMTKMNCSNNLRWKHGGIGIGISFTVAGFRPSERVSSVCAHVTIGRK